MSAVAYNPFDPEVRRNPYPTYARLRAEAPLFRSDALGLAVASRYQDVVQVLKDPRDFSSRAMADLLAGGARQLGDDDPITGETLIGTDPPLHTRLRKIVNRAFTPKRIAALEPRIRHVARELVQGFIGRGSCELVRDFAIPLPVTIIAEILGVDPARRDDFKRWSDDLLLLATGRPTPEEQDSIRASDAELDEWIDEAVRVRRAHPEDDLISALVAAEAVEEAMTREEVRNLIALLLVAGNETTTHLIANSVLALLEHPDALAALRDAGSVPAPAVEELLRYTSPVQLTLRRAMREVELPAGKIAEGETVVALIASANRDDRQFADAERLDLSRDARSHVAFGLGTHFCIGANLARLEARVGLQELLGLGEIERSPEPLEFAPSILVRGPLELGLRFEARES